MRKWMGYQRGVNLGGWLSQCDYSREHLDHFIGEEDIGKIAEWGADHVRLPIDYNVLEAGVGKYLEEGFELIERAVEWCMRHGLNIVLDLHKTAGYSFDADEREEGFFLEAGYQERFYALWEEIARRSGGRGDRVAFELLNEIVEKEVCGQWNEISAKCISRIRAIAPDTKILLGGYWNNNVMAVKDLAVPADKNVVYNFHCYDPILFTHQGATWMPEIPEDFRIVFPKTMEEYLDVTGEIMPDALSSLTEAGGVDGMLGASYFEALFSEAVRTAQERDVMLYCGEYGVIDRADADSTLSWYDGIHQAFERYGIGRAAWCYKGLNYGLASEHLDGVRAQILRRL